MTLVRPPRENDEQPEETTPVVLRGRKEKIIQPIHNDLQNPAANLIRQKLERLYAEEPDTATEVKEAEIVKPRSKHQEFMYNLSNSGKSLAEIQTEWHAYYLNLSNDEKHQVWQEFYEANSATKERLETAKPVVEEPVVPEETKQEDTSQKPDNLGEQNPLLPTIPNEAAEKPTRTDTKLKKVKIPPRAKVSKQPQKVEESKEKVIVSNPIIAERAARLRPRTDPRSIKEIKDTVLNKVNANGQVKVKHNLHSLFFGLASGIVAIIIIMFGFFNEVIIAPLIQPSRTASAAPIIVNSVSSDAYKNPEIIIPKLNIEIPIDYNETTIDEDAIQNGLQNGVVHYPITAEPGQNGNAAFFGHSSSNIFNNGKYKFAFVLLHEMEVGDTFYLTKDGKIYVYQVFNKYVVPPTDVSVLDPVQGETATATLITCDPPGRNINRLIVVGRQISPDPASNAQANTARSASTTVPANTQLPGNGPSAWSRFWGWVF